MPESKHFSQSVSIFHGRVAPEKGQLTGYVALINFYRLQVPTPDNIAIISQKHKRYETSDWLVFTPRHAPEDSLAGHLTFALKYEGINLGILKALFDKIEQTEIHTVIAKEPTGQYSRRIWFLYEWLLNVRLNIEDVISGSYVDLVDEKLQYAGVAETSKRHRIRNNLPGVRDFCPMIQRTEKLEGFINQYLPAEIKNTLGHIHPDVMARAASFLLLKDSKASYAIEGEHPPQNRAQRWGRAIGQAGQRSLSEEELLRLQQIVIDNPRFLKMGWREQEGFVGEYDRRTGAPIPDHISAKWKDVPTLIAGLIATDKKLEASVYDAVLAAAVVAFGFVFIHPFVDGNGRIHRYLIHHVLLRKDFVPKGFIFPVSSVILERLDEYRQALEAYSFSLLDLIDWEPGNDNNISIKNGTIDYYRYFDATKQAEFLYSCVEQTVRQTVPEEVAYLEKYDLMKSYLEEWFEMPDKMVALLIRFLEQGKGILSARARNKEFKGLTEKEVQDIQARYLEIFNSP